MPVLHAIVLGLVQGLSEFLPISSSGHLILVPDLFGWTELTRNPPLNKTFDVALHLGTLVGALWYFRVEVGRYAVAGWQSIRTRSLQAPNARMAWLLLMSAIPGAILGALFETTIEDNLGKPELIGAMLIIFGAVLLWADRRPQRRQFDDLRVRDAALMGVAQALALQPGVSRAGVTISEGRWLGFDRDGATRISFLMSLPIIAGAVVFKGAKMAANGGIPHDFAAPFVWGTLAAAISGLLAITVLLRILRTRSFLPFVVYRFVAGAAVIVIFGTGIR